jgi:protein-L-isoaspartate(D-aspartate) O-methyltransferase
MMRLGYAFLGLIMVASLAVQDSVASEGYDVSYEEKKMRMVKDQLEARGITDQRVLDAIEGVNRHDFVPPDIRNMAYEDYPLPIGFGQTISQPYIVAYMTEAARLKESDRVLEIGTGSGYQAAVLARLVSEVYSMEILTELAHKAQERLKSLGYHNVHVQAGDGYKGWEKHAPFDAVIVTAAPAAVPLALLDQLGAGGRMIIPVGSFHQALYRYTKTETGIKKEKLLPVRFVPMVPSED